MKFCDECGSMMVPTKEEDGTRALKCRSCGFIQTIEGSMKVEHKIKKTPRDKIVIVEDDSIPMPTTAADCPKCSHNEAYYWTLQTRRGDEGATEFYRCVKCKHTWRNYGG